MTLFTQIVQLFFSFFKIGLFSYGGGLAMVPIIRDEMVAKFGIAIQEFADITTVSQMTPGPLAVNMATYVGYKVAGIVGSVAATIGVALPSFLLILLVVFLLRKVGDLPQMNWIMKGIRPVTVGVLCSAGIFFIEQSVFRSGALSFDLSDIRYMSFVIIGLVLFLSIRFKKVNQIWWLLLAGGLGLVLF